MNINISKAPELDWLKANSVNGTPEGVDTVDKEFKRTWCSIVLFDAVVNNNYTAFSACQPEAVRITESSFNEIRSYVLEVLPTAEDQDAMRAFLVINDLGKVEDFVQKIATTLGFESVDHDKILYEGLKADPKQSPTFNALESKYQDIILTGLKTAFNMGQYVQCECLPANLAPLTDLDETTLNYYMIHVLFDIAGAAGHVVSNGSIICNELYWKKFSWALVSIRNMVNGRINPVEAYDEYVSKTMEFFDVHNDVIAKLCNLIRVSTANEASEIECAFEMLDNTVKSTLTAELSKTGIGDSAILMYYAPATFQNAFDYYKKADSENAIRKTVLKVAPVLAALYEGIRKRNQSECGVTIAFIADVARAAKDPETLEISFSFEQVGDDFNVMVNNTK